MRILVSAKGLPGTIPNTQIGCEGKVWRYKPELVSFGPASLRQIALPRGTGGVDRRPSWVHYNFGRHSRMYGVGGWTANVLIDEHMRMMRQGIPAPNVVPLLTAGAGPGVTNTSTLFLRFGDSLGNRFGPMSAPSAPLALSNQSRVSGAIPTTCPDPSVDIIQGLMAVDGLSPRVAWTRQLGTGNVTEAVATLALGDPAPDDFEAMPLGNMNLLFHDVQVVSGGRLNPERAHLSAVSELERYEGLFAQTDGEPVTGLFCQGDYFFMGSHERIYRVQGFTAQDINREVEKPDMGLINHDCIVNLHRRVILCTTVGWQMYDGNWFSLMRDRAKEFEREYKLFRAQYEAAQAFYNPRRNAYIFGPVPHSKMKASIGSGTPLALDQVGLVDWVLDAKSLLPSIEASDFDVKWTNDVRYTPHITRTTFYLPQSGEPLPVAGTTRGQLQYELEAGDDKDLMDTAPEIDRRVRARVRYPTLSPDQGGGLTDGNRFQRLWIYGSRPTENPSDVDPLVNEGLVVNLSSGPPSVGDQGVVVKDRQTLTRPPREGGTSDYDMVKPEAPFPLERLAGEALSIEVELMNGRFGGFGLTFNPGPKKTILVPRGGGE